MEVLAEPMSGTSAEWLRNLGEAYMDSNVERSTHWRVLYYAVKSNQYMVNPARDKNEEWNLKEVL